MTEQSDEDTFDRCVRQGMVKIKNTLGILINRWEILKKFSVNVKYVAIVFNTSFILHNFCRYSCNNRQVTLSRHYIDIMPNKMISTLKQKIKNNQKEHLSV